MPGSLASDQISKNLTFAWASFASTDRFLWHRYLHNTDHMGLWVTTVIILSNGKNTPFILVVDQGSIEIWVSGNLEYLDLKDNSGHRVCSQLMDLFFSRTRSSGRSGARC